MSPYSIIVAAHVAVGALALGTFWTAALLRKGSPLHRRVGQAYLLAMLGIIVTAVPMVGFKLHEGHSVTAAFLAYLVVITATGVWGAWRAIRDKHDVDRYTGVIYQLLATLSIISGAAVLVLGLREGAPLLIGFSAVGLVIGADMLRKRRHRKRLASQPRWWMVEHYGAMIGNGVATHIAFLSLGLPRLLPGVDGTALHYAGWFAPLFVAVAARVLLDRRWKPRNRLAPAAPASTSLSARS